MNQMLEGFLSDPNADVGTGLLVSRGCGFCFTLKQSSRWGKTEQGIPTLPFGGIGGKLEKGELPAASLHREALEEVGSDVEIDSSKQETILMETQSIKKISLTTSLPDEPLPCIIFQSAKGEAGRKPFTNVLIYKGKFVSPDIHPIDDPAIIELDSELLVRVSEDRMSLSEFLAAGGKIVSSIDLPEEGILTPIGTALAAARCLKAGLLTYEDICF